MDTVILARVEDFCIREGLLQPGASQHLAAAVSGGADSMALLQMCIRDRYKALADAEPDVIFGGRLGEYKYYDMDKVIEVALDVAAKELA